MSKTSVRSRNPKPVHDQKPKQQSRPGESEREASDRYKKTIREINRATETDMERTLTRFGLVDSLRS